MVTEAKKYCTRCGKSVGNLHDKVYFGSSSFCSCDSQPKVKSIVQKVEEELAEFARVHDETDSMKWAASIVDTVSQDIIKKFNKHMDFTIGADESCIGLLSKETDERVHQSVRELQFAKKVLEMVINKQEAL